VKGLIPTLVVLAVVLPLLSARAQSVHPLTAHGDDLYTQRADPQKARQALATYQRALASGEDAYELYWRMAMAEYRIAGQTADGTEKRRVLDLGVYYAKKAIQVAPERPEGHYWLGVNYGVSGETKGARKGLSLVKPIKEEMNKLLAIDPLYAGGGADRILGRLYYELPEDIGGNKQRSLKHLLKAKDYGPQFALTRLYLADTYRALDDLTKAREELEYVIAMEPDPHLVPETAEAKEMARKKLAELDLKGRK